MNYGGRNDIINAVHFLICDVETSKLAPEEINEAMLSHYLYIKGLPDPKIVFRTGGEKRISNFLLWQSAKTEFWFTDTLFRDFDKEILIKAIEEINGARW
jgi:undecaprenyl diphosphate synthase